MNHLRVNSPSNHPFGAQKAPSKKDASSKAPESPVASPSSSKSSRKASKQKGEDGEKEVKVKEVAKEEEEEEDDLSLSITDSDSEGADSSSAQNAEGDAIGASGNKRKLSWIQKKKKGLASRAAGSSLGNALFQKHVDKETQSLIGSVCEIIAHEKGKKRASQTKKEILKVAVKILVLYNEKKVTEDSFNTLAFAFRRICSSVRNAYHARSLNEATATRIHGLAQTLEQHLHAALQGLVTENTFNRIHDLLDFIFNPELLVAANKYDKEFQQIAMVLAHYLETAT